MKILNTNRVCRIFKGAEFKFEIIYKLFKYSGGERIRKHTLKENIKEERIYLGSYEIYRKYVNNVLDIERTTVHVSDDTGRVAMIEKRIVGTDPSSASLQRYIYCNHLQSASLELDGSGEIISYEEYHPYGTTSYQANNSDIKAVAKRYRYTGKERDEESGLYYHGARYYVPWLARWSAVDSKADVGHNIPLSPYCAMGNNSILNIDPDGQDFIKSVKSVYTLGAPKVIHDLANTNFNQLKWYSISFNRKTNEFDIKLNYQVAYSKFFKQQYDNNGTKATLEGENPGLFGQVEAHEMGHVDQMFEQASEANLFVKFEFGGLKKTYKGQADDILTNIYKDYKKARKVSNIEEFNKNILP